MNDTRSLRKHLIALLDWKDAHVGFDAVVAGLSADVLGARPASLPYSPWELLEHLRLAQRDILDFCRDPSYSAPSWPADYWPPTPGPPAPGAWETSVAAFRDDRLALERMAGDPKVDLFATIPHGEGQTYLRELLLVADHNAFHLGELVVVRRLLGAWPPVRGGSS